MLDEMFCRSSHPQLPRPLETDIWPPTFMLKDHRSDPVGGRILTNAKDAYLQF